MKNNEEVSRECLTNLELRISIKEPPLYQVVVHNDDYTPMEFVVGILEKFFYMERKVAAEIMLEAHVKGKALCGIFSRDYAESKIHQIIDHARTHEHPLICSMEAL